MMPRTDGRRDGVQCTNYLTDGRMRWRCVRLCREGETVCRVCVAAATRGAKRSEDHANRELARYERRSMLEAAREAVIQAARAELLHAHVSDALRNAVLDLDRLENEA